jgi:hypothetical protein
VSAEKQRPFDEVQFSSEGGTRRLSLEEFLALRLPDRVRVILHAQTVFVTKGKQIEKRVALAALKEWPGPARPPK